jgi:hypothetical protein
LSLKSGEDVPVIPLGSSRSVAEVSSEVLEI